MRRLIHCGLFCLATTASLLLAGCGGGESESPRGRRRNIDRGIFPSRRRGAPGGPRKPPRSVKKPAKRGVDLKFADAQGKQANQIKAIRSFVTQRVGAIVLAPVVETGWEPVLREAKRANIPVILVDRGIETGDDSLYTTLIASDFVEEGRMPPNGSPPRWAGPRKSWNSKARPARRPPSTARKASTKSF